MLIKHEVYHITNHDGFLAEYKIKNEIERLLFKYKQLLQLLLK